MFSINDDPQKIQWTTPQQQHLRSSRRSACRLPSGSGGEINRNRQILELNTSCHHHDHDSTSSSCRKFRSQSQPGPKSRNSPAANDVLSHNKKAKFWFPKIEKRENRSSYCSNDTGRRSSPPQSETDGDWSSGNSISFSKCCSFANIDAQYENDDTQSFNTSQRQSSEYWCGCGTCGSININNAYIPTILYHQQKSPCSCQFGNVTSEEQNGTTGYFSSSKLQLLRRKTVQELMSTERKYVRLLENLVQGYLTTCRRRWEIFPDEQKVQGIFGNLESIYELHALFFRELQSALNKKEPEHSELANVFLRNIKHFDIYIDYCNNRTLSCTELTQMEKQPKFSQFFETCRLLRGLPPLPLDAFLLTPVQKICLYPLQLMELLKATPSGHPDRVPLEIAQQQMKQMTEKINEGRRRLDAIQNIWLWQKSVHGFRGNDIFELNHRLLINGELYCRALWKGKLKWSKMVRIYVFDQTIVFCLRNMLRRSQLVFKERMSLEGTSIKDLSDGKGKEPKTSIMVKNAFKVTGHMREYIFECPDPASKGLWMEILKNRPNPQPPTPAEKKLAVLL